MLTSTPSDELEVPADSPPRKFPNKPRGKFPQQTLGVSLQRIFGAAARPPTTGHPLRAPRSRRGSFLRYAALRGGGFCGLWTFSGVEGG